MEHDEVQRLLDQMVKVTHSWMAVIQELSVQLREKKDRIKVLEWRIRELESKEG